MVIKEACQWLQDLGFPTEIRESDWLFPSIETVHVLALTLVIGSILMVDVRLLGIGNRARSVRSVTEQYLPLTWVSFAVAAGAGALLFSSKAVTYFGDFPFRLKMVCLALAGINMAYFHRSAFRRVAEWDHGRPPLGARVAGGLSLLLWTVIVGAGRWVGFTT
ncbi:MAG: DUF6644 family protein [Steroidobacteraceae bacterium]|jgi:hypothetical protein